MAFWCWEWSSLDVLCYWWALSLAHIQWKLKKRKKEKRERRKKIRIGDKEMMTFCNNDVRPSERSWLGRMTWHFWHKWENAYRYYTALGETVRKEEKNFDSFTCWAMGFSIASRSTYTVVNKYNSCDYKTHEGVGICCTSTTFSNNLFPTFSFDSIPVSLL